ncbi:MAG: 50S ribosomal protein L25 [Anaerolineaceae bacterium]|nr:MAG: 50S ribosomal protein L25 [Anaerolineaceae bacterium]
MIQFKEEHNMAKAAGLNVEVRKEVSKKENKRLQNNGYIIGVINQKGLDSIPVAVKKDEFRRVLKENGRNAILKLQDSDKNSYDVMVKTIELSPMKFEYYHIDFQKVSLTEEVKVDVAIRFLGTDFLKPKRLILNRQMDSILVTGLPQDIPDSIDVDVTEKESGDSIFVSDLVLGKGITTDLDQELLVASIGEAKVVVEETEEEEEQVLVAGEVEQSTEE